MATCLELRLNEAALQLNNAEKAGSKARIEIERLVNLLQIRPIKEVIDSAHRLYMLGVQHNFTKGRRTSHVSFPRARNIYLRCLSCKLITALQFIHYCQLTVVSYSDPSSSPIESSVT